MTTLQHFTGGFCSCARHDTNTLRASRDPPVICNPLLEPGTVHGPCGQKKKEAVNPQAPTWSLSNYTRPRKGFFERVRVPPGSTSLCLFEPPPPPPCTLAVLAILRDQFRTRGGVQTTRPKFGFFQLQTFQNEKSTAHHTWLVVGQTTPPKLDTTSSWKGWLVRSGGGGYCADWHRGLYKR